MSTLVWQGKHRLLTVIGTAVTRQCGYVWVKYPDHPGALYGCVPLHRIIMENHLDRYLVHPEGVHHVDLDKTNNSIENLELYADAAEHGRRHTEQGTLGFFKHIEWPDEAAMLRLLKRMTIGATARKLGVSRDSVVRWCRRHDVPDRSFVDGQLRTTAELCPPKAELQRLVQKKTLRQIATQMDVSIHNIRSWCSKLGIEQQPLGYWGQKDPPDREELSKLLEVSLMAAVRHYRVAPRTIKKWAKQLDLSLTLTPTRRSSLVDESLFQECHTKVLVGELSIAQAEILLELREYSFSVLCSERNLDLNIRNPAASKSKRHYSVDKLKETAARVRSGHISRRLAAAEAGCASITYKKRCARHGIELPVNNRKAPKKPRPDKATLQRHLDSGMSRDTMARKYKVSIQTCSRWLKRYALTFNYSRIVNLKPSKEDLTRLVWEKPVVKLAEDFGISPTTVYSWTSRYNIDLPPRGHWRRPAKQPSVNTKRSSLPK